MSEWNFSDNSKGTNLYSRMGSNYENPIAEQTKYNDYRKPLVTETTPTSALGSYTPNLGDKLAQSGNLDAARAWYEDKYSNNVNPPSIKTESGFWSGVGDTLSDTDLMDGVLGIGNLGLGLANYFTMKDVAEEQLKGLKQDRKIAEYNFETKKDQAKAFKPMSAIG